MVRILKGISTLVDCAAAISAFLAVNLLLAVVGALPFAKAPDFSQGIGDSCAGLIFWGVVAGVVVGLYLLRLLLDLAVAWATRDRSGPGVRRYTVQPPRPRRRAIGGN